MSNTILTSEDFQDFIMRSYESLSDRVSPQQTIAFIFVFVLMKMNNILSELEKPYQTNLYDHLLRLKEQGKIDESLYAVLLLCFGLFDEKNKIDKLSSSFIDELNSIDSPIDRVLVRKLFEKLVQEKIFDDRRNGLETSISQEFSKFLVHFLGIKEGESVYCTHSMIAHPLSFLPANTSFYYSNRFNSELNILTSLKLQLYGIDFISSTIGDKDRSYNFDNVIATPPFHSKYLESQSINGFTVKTEEESVFIDVFNKLNNKGKLLALVSSRLIQSNGIDKYLRKRIIKDDLLETVIFLPTGVFGKRTQIKGCLVLLNRNKQKKRFTRFVDASYADFKSKTHKQGFCHSEFLESLNQLDENSYIDVSSKDISLNNYSFNPFIYLLERFKLSHGGSELSEVAEIIKTGGTKEKGYNYLIRLTDLKDDISEFTFSDLHKKRIPKSSRLISESALFVGKYFMQFKPSFFVKNFGQEVFISRDILALRIDTTKIDIEYLIHELRNSNTNKQLHMLSKGSILGTLSEKDILSIVINIPSIEEQKAKIKGFKEAILQKKKEEVEHFKMIHGLETELKLQNSFLRHSLAGPVTNLESMITNVSSIFENQIFHLYPTFKNLRLTDKHKNTLGQMMEIIQRDIKSVHQLIKRQLNTDNPFIGYESSQIDIYDYLENYVKEKKESGINYQLNLEQNDNLFKANHKATNKRLRSIYIEGNPDVLRVLFDNLLSNAEKHGFKYSKYKKVEISLLEYEENADIITICVQNSGKPFPPGFDYISFFNKGYSFGASGGDGTGGWLFDKALQFLKGECEIVDQTYGDAYHESDFVTCFDIWFPISQIK